jgi:hypothetical protein
MDKARLGAALGVFALVTACNNNAAPIPLDQLAGREAAVLCGYLQRCNLATGFSQVTGSAGGDCTSTLTPYFASQVFGQYQLAINAGTLVYHPDQAGQCLAAFDGLACGGFTGAAPPACNATFEGRVMDGGACTLTQECNATSTCTGAAGMTCGMCTHTPQLGEPCPMGTCASAAYCDATHTCTARVAAGGACDTTMASMCAVGTTCHVATGSTMGTCQMPMSMTTTCGSSTMTCAAGQLCVFENSMFTCRAPRTDGTCGQVVSGGSDCTGATSCDTTMMRCVPYPTLGQTCTNVCAAPARCVNHMCQPSTSIGGSCASNDECISGLCSMGTCSAHPLCTH